LPALNTFFFIKFGKYPSFFVYLQSKCRTKYFIGYVLEDFRFAKNGILLKRLIRRFAAPSPTGEG
jgi:hypothetical protein